MRIPRRLGMTVVRVEWPSLFNCQRAMQGRPRGVAPTARQIIASLPLHPPSSRLRRAGEPDKLGISPSFEEHCSSTLGSTCARRSKFGLKFVDRKFVSCGAAVSKNFFIFFRNWVKKLARAVLCRYCGHGSGPSRRQTYARRAIWRWIDNLPDAAFEKN
jgi:hypothetical protein